MRARYEARQSHDRLKSTLELKTVNN